MSHPNSKFKYLIVHLPSRYTSKYYYYTNRWKSWWHDKSNIWGKSPPGEGVKIPSVVPENISSSTVEDKNIFCLPPPFPNTHTHTLLKIPIKVQTFFLTFSSSCPWSPPQEMSNPICGSLWGRAVGYEEFWKILHSRASKLFYIVF